MKWIIILFFIVFFEGCAGIRLTPRKCKTEGVYGDESLAYTRKIEKEYFVFLDDKEVYLADLVSCSHVKKMKVTIENKWFFYYKIIIDFKDENYP